MSLNHIRKLLFMYMLKYSDSSSFGTVVCFASDIMVALLSLYPPAKHHLSSAFCMKRTRSSGIFLNSGGVFLSRCLLLTDCSNIQGQRTSV